MSKQFEQLIRDLSDYRTAVNKICSTSLQPSEFRDRIFDVLVSTSKLNLDYLLISRQLRNTEMVPSKYSHIPTNLQREELHRAQLRAYLESWGQWSHFDLQDPFSELNGLRTRGDYIDCLALHLPEIYEESFRVEQCAKEFLLNRSDLAGTQLLIGLEHMGRNHISFLQQALGSLAKDSLWDE